MTLSPQAPAAPDAPRILKARRLEGKTLVMRDADVGDADFIHTLRTDPAKSRHLAVTSADPADQRRWLTDYAASTGHAYFVIEHPAGEPLGAVRLYDARGASFCWGSWVLKAGAPASAAIESALMVYAYALDTLGFRNAHFEVRKGNERVWRFHERFGAEKVGETELARLYALSGESIAAARLRYARFLSDPLVVHCT